MDGLLNQQQPQGGLLEFLQSPQFRGLSEGLLAAGNPNQGKVGLIQALGMGGQGVNAAVDREKAKQFEEMMKMLQMQQLMKKDEISPYQREYLDIMKGNQDLRKNPSAKPMPATAVKLQNEEMEALKTANSISADLGSVIDTIESGQLKLGPVQNKISGAMNWLGNSDENSRNFATFQSTLEKLRNDSLRLNKGVQTEGDAVRAWDEILKNVTDEKFVAQRLKEVQKINERAADLKKLSIDQIRTNFGAEPMDYSGLQSQPAILGNSPTQDNVVSFEEYFK